MRFPQMAKERGYKGPLGNLTWVASDYYIQIYLDDILILTFEKARCTEVLAGFLALLTDLGVLYHPHKC